MIHKDITLFGLRIRLHIYPAWVDKRYYELKQRIVWEKDEEKKNRLIAERAKLGDKYKLDIP
jgi:hypothetical protein